MAPERKLAGVAVRDAQVGQPEVNLGIIPGAEGTQRLPRLVGKGRALQLILTGGIIDAQEAWRIGLVNEVVPADQLIHKPVELSWEVAGSLYVVAATAYAAVRAVAPQAPGFPEPSREIAKLDARTSAPVPRPARRTAYWFKEKITSIVVSTSTGSPLRRVGR